MGDQKQRALKMATFCVRPLQKQKPIPWYRN